jgi:hypothetical protein
MPPNVTPRPLPAAVVRQREGGVLHREGQYRAKLAYVYFEDEPGRRSAASLLSRDEARRIRSQHRQAAGFAAQVHALFADGRAFNMSNCIPQLSDLNPVRPAANAWAATAA